MKRILESSEKESFIGSWIVFNDNLFENIINFFENNQLLHTQGRMDNGINIKEKKTTDMTIDPLNLKDQKYSIFREYFDELYKCYEDYKKQWPFINENIKILDIPSFNVQRYLAGEHFSKIHSERMSTSTSHRVFAWMTYLNDLEEDSGGYTNFHHFGLKIRPQKGKTLIWPAEWTHAHSGEILKFGKKYIITGWMCFPFN